LADRSALRDHEASENIPRRRAAPPPDQAVLSWCVVAREFFEVLDAILRNS
jgi:hypothetical protein